MVEETNAEKSPSVRLEHSEAYWQLIKWVILSLAVLMMSTLVLAVIVVLRLIPWS